MLDKYDEGAVTCAVGRIAAREKTLADYRFSWASRSNMSKSSTTTR
jgi:hypothetical protein